MQVKANTQRLTAGMLLPIPMIILIQAKNECVYLKEVYRIRSKLAVFPGRNVLRFWLA